MRLLIVGEMSGAFAAAGKIALERGAKLTQAEDIEGALRGLRAGRGADLVMIDVALDIRLFIERLTAERFALPVVACGTATDTRMAVEAIRAGAKEYIPLPPDAELIAAVLEAVTEERRGLVSDDPAMRPILDLARRVAPSEASVLVTGESGTGKEVVSRYLHEHSKRAKRAFVSVNCAAIPDNLLESELFGHEKGAFTGAVSRRVGKFEEADGGTLLLDEISEMDPRLQAKLLRAIQEREIDRVGGSQPVKVDIRLIATSNRDLEEEVAAGRFREDLYFRLNVVNLALPPLRERQRDIETLSLHFLARYAEANGLPCPRLTEEAKAALLAHEWPGNVRELENAMHRAVLLAQGNVVGPEAVAATPGAWARETVRERASAPAPAETYRGPAETAPSGSAEAAAAEEAERQRATQGLVGRTVAEVERDLILDTLDHCLGNRTHAANVLGISIRTLRNKLKAYSDEGIPVPQPGQADQALA